MDDKLELKLRYYDGETGFDLRQVALGHQPFILLEPEVLEDSSMKLTIHSSLIEPEQVLYLFGLLSELKVED